MQVTSTQLTRSGGVVALLKNKQFDQIIAAVPSSVEKIMNARLISDLVRQVGRETIQEFLEQEINRVALQMNVANNVAAFQVPFIAEALLENYPNESLADFILCFRRMAIGYYGSTYHRLDASVFVDCITKHIEEKAYYRERDNANSKKAADFVPLVNYAAYKKRLEENRKKEREEKIEKIVKEAEAKDVPAYIPPSPEQILARDSHRLYLSAKWKHDKDLRNKGQVFPEEAVWIELQKK